MDLNSFMNIRTMGTHLLFLISYSPYTTEWNLMKLSKNLHHIFPLCIPYFRLTQIWPKTMWAIAITVVHCLLTVFFLQFSPQDVLNRIQWKLIWLVHRISTTQWLIFYLWNSRPILNLIFWVIWKKNFLVKRTPDDGC